MRPWSSGVLSEVTSRHSCIRNGVKPQISHRRVQLDRTFSALNPLFRMVGKDYNLIFGEHPLRLRGTLSTAREAFQVLDLAGCASAQGWTKGHFTQSKRQFFLILEIAKENATSVQRHSRRWHLPLIQSVYSLSTRHSEWSIFYLLLPTPLKAQAIYLSNPYSGWFSHFIYRFGKHKDRLSVSYGRIPRPVQAPSGTTAHTTKILGTFENF